jgi:predicted RNA binding protein YcfA (HicA-like mRNA interferase family)
MANRLPAFSSRQLIRALLKLGFEATSGGKGSHTKLVYPGQPGALTIPENRHFGKGLRSALIKQIEQMGVDRKDLLDVL